MRFTAVLLAGLVLLALAACGGGDDAVPVPSELADVCGQEDATLAPELVEITAPAAGDTVKSPLRVTGQINAIGEPGQQGTFWVSLVLPDGTHIIDYPSRATQSGQLVSFDQSVPFSYFESTPACVWIYRENIDGAEARRIPVTIDPAGPEGEQ